MTGAPRDERTPRPEPPSVVERVSERTGASARVRLHDSDSLEGGPPIVDPKAGEGVRFPAARHHYQVLGEIARGGMGVVLKAHDTELGREVAIKVLDERFSDQQVVLQRFVEEAQIGGQLQHPGVVPVYELGALEDERPFIAMKLVKGRTLSALLHDRKSPAEDRRRFLTIFESVCQTVAYAHSKGVIHRDLKPANVLVGAFGEVLVGDWGLAKVLGRGGVEDEQRARRSDLTVIETVRSGPGSVGSDSVVGSVMGTPAYMPPEQALGEVEKLDQRSDVFALGAILCEILTGQPPYLGTENERTVVQAAQARLDPARARIEACEADSELKALMLECLSPARAARPRDGREVARRVHEHLASADERARAAELAAAEAQVKVAAARRERALGLGLAAALLLGVFSAGAFLRSRTLNRIARAAELRDRLDDGAEQVLALREGGQLSEALEVARTTAGLVAASPWAEPPDRERAERLVADVERRARIEAEDRSLEERNQRMLARLDELRLEFLELAMTNRQGEIAAGYAAAFEDYGTPVDFDDPDPFVEAVRFSGIQVELAAALDAWATAVRVQRGWKDMQGRLLTYMAMDLDPDEGRTEVRNAILEVDAGKLAEFALAARERGHTPEIQFTILSALRWLPTFRTGTESEEIDISAATSRLFPDDFLMNAVEGLTRQRQGAFEQAIAALRAAVALQPNSAVAQYHLGVCLERTGLLPAAIEAFRRADELGYEPAKVHYRMGLGFWDLGRYEQAVRAIERSVATGEGGRDRLIDLAAVRYLAGRSTRDELLAEFEAHANPGPSAWAGLAACLLDHPACTVEDAERALEAIRRAGPPQADPYIAQGLCLALFELDRVEQLLRELESWERTDLGQQSEFAALRACLRARCLHRQGREREAQDELEVARTLAGRVIGSEQERWAGSRLARHLRAAEDELGG